MEEPVPAGVPSHEPVYQCHEAPEDNEPLTCSVELLPAQMGEVPPAETGSAGIVATLTVALIQLEEHVPFSALAKQVVVDNGETETEAPVPTGVPPQEPEYHFHEAPAERFPVNERVDDPAEHKNVGDAVKKGRLTC